MNETSAPHSPALTAETGTVLPATIEPSLPAVPAEPRWSPERMAAFIEEFAATQCVGTAARRVGMSRQSAYRLRARSIGEDFDVAWALAQRQGQERLYRAALARAVNGIEVPVYQRGELIGSRRHFDERLTCYLLTRGSVSYTPQPRKRSDGAERWSGRFEELIERLRESDEKA